VLDAPSLRDDYYCSVLAYCHSAQVLAVGLANRVYLWSEAYGVRYPPDDQSARHSTYVTSVSFSSSEGGHSILAIGRSSGQISLWSLDDPEDIRFQSQQPCAIACVAFKPVTTRRPSERLGCMIPTEELLVGDEVGHVYYYSIEWMSKQQVDIHGWTGAMTLLAKITVHVQQVCGLAWSADGDYFATGANDNACCLFEVRSILTPPDTPQDISAIHRSPLQTLLGGFGMPNFIARAHTHSEIMGILANGVHTARSRVIPRQHGSLLIGEGSQKHKWIHSAAIKAVAFCPWQRGLIATGGGSNDRAIHFYHTFSGACLATISVHAQVTALIWSTTRREIAATFGYAQPDHPYRVAVFSWPDCRQIVAIPWGNDLRALYAISYPGGPGETTSMGQTWYSRTKEEGCIVVACSDESVKFHEVWSGASRSTGSHLGLLGGSDILESLEGIDKEGTEVIR
jgi:WD40 repeat protein